MFSIKKMIAKEAVMIVPVKDANLIKIVADLAAEIWTEHYTPIIGAEQVEYMVDKFQSYRAITKQIEGAYLYYLIQDREQFVGYIGVELKEEELFLSKFYVKSDQRGKGLGREGFDFIEQLATQKGLNKIALTVNKYNSVTIEIYLKLGFVNVGPIVTDIGNGFIMDDFLLEKEIP